MGFSFGNIGEDLLGGGELAAGAFTGNPMLMLSGGATLGGSLFGGSGSGSGSQPNYTPSYAGNLYGAQAGQMGLGGLQEYQGGGISPQQQALVTSNLNAANAATNSYMGQAGLGSSTMASSAIANNGLQSEAMTAQLNQGDIQNALGELGMAQYSQGNNAALLDYNMKEQQMQNSGFSSLFSSLGNLAGMGGFSSLGGGGTDTTAQDTNGLTYSDPTGEGAYS